MYVVSTAFEAPQEIIESLGFIGSGGEFAHRYMSRELKDKMKMALDTSKNDLISFANIGLLYASIFDYYSGGFMEVRFFTDDLKVTEIRFLSLPNLFFKCLEYYEPVWQRAYKCLFLTVLLLILLIVLVQNNSMEC